MDTSFEHKGHQVEILVTGVGKKFHWSYRIDGAEPVPLDESGARTHDLAVLEAAQAAKARIDRMKG